MNAILGRIPLRLTPFSILGLMLAVVGCGTIAVDIRTEIISQQEIKQNLEYVISGPLTELFITDGEIDLGEDAELADLEALETAGWDVLMEVTQVEGEDALRVRISQTFTGEDAAEQFRLASVALSEEDTSTSMIPFLDITETEDEIVYELRMSVEVDEGGDSSLTFDEPVEDFEPLVINGTPFPDLPAFSDSDSTGDMGEFGDFGAEIEDAFTDGLQDFTDALESSLGDFITMKWTVEMPGHVRDSNATDEDGSELTWNMGISDLSEGGNELFARSVVNKNAAGSCNL